MSSLFGIDPAQMAMGVHARQVPLNMIFQEQGETKDRHAGVFQFQYDTDLMKRFKGRYTHVLLLGDAIIRPRIIVGTNALQGSGIGGIYRDGFHEVLENLGKNGTEELFRL